MTFVNADSVIPSRVVGTVDSLLFELSGSVPRRDDEDDDWLTAGSCDCTTDMETACGGIMAAMRAK